MNSRFMVGALLIASTLTGQTDEQSCSAENLDACEDQCRTDAGAPACAMLKTLCTQENARACALLCFLHPQTYPTACAGARVACVEGGSDLACALFKVTCATDATATACAVVDKLCDRGDSQSCRLRCEQTAGDPNACEILIE